MLDSLEVADPNCSTVVRFKTHEVRPKLHYDVDFQVHVECLNNTIKHIVVKEGVATSMMSLDCCKGIGSPVLYKSVTMLTTLDGCIFQYAWYYSLPSSIVWREDYAIQS